MTSACNLLPLIVLLAACKPPPDERHHMPGADAKRGREVIERVACGSCHRIPGVYWPKGEVGPSLRGFAQQGLIGGRLPNRPEILSAWVRDAPMLIPETTMPAMPIDEQEARDVAAYLYTLRD